MEPRYLRNVPALTREECALLRTKKIAVSGCGGLGGHPIDLRARWGIGSILAVARKKPGLRQTVSGW